MKHTMLLALDASAVEGKPPTAFRIWKIGPVETTKGTFQFTEESAKAILAEQAARNVLTPIDVEHGSFAQGAPLAARAACGWCSLEMRGDELWAVGVELNDEMRAELAKDVPGFRYTSPAFETNESGEITSLVNIAITNTPATLDAPQLASRTARPDVAARKAERARLLAAATWLAPAVRRELSTLKLETVRECLAALAPKATNRGDEPQKDEPVKDQKPYNPANYDRETMRASLDRRMGTSDGVPDFGVRHGVQMVLGSLTPEQTRVLNSMSPLERRAFTTSTNPTERAELYHAAEYRLRWGPPRPTTDPKAARDVVEQLARKMAGKDQVK